jgi:hypothetical protein
MAQLAVEEPPNRVVYRDLMYTFCRHCFNLIGIAKTEKNLALAERSHRCPAMLDKNSDANRY